MSSLFVALIALVTSSFRTRVALQAEILALRHQLAVFQKSAPRRLRLQRSDRLLWVLLSRWWPGWRRSLHIVRPDTVIAWHGRAFAWYWTRKSRRRPGRRNVPAEIRGLIRNMSQANPLWGAPRIHGELLKLGIAVAQSTVAKYLSFTDIEEIPHSVEVQAESLYEAVALAVAEFRTDNLTSEPGPMTEFTIAIQRPA